MKRFQDTGETLYGFQDEFWVRCPRCQACAMVRCRHPEQMTLFAPRRFTCSTCGMVREWPEQATTLPRYGEPVDSYFHYPLWLQTPCCGHILWAYNLRHLQVIEAFVEAELRERQPHPQSGWFNRSLASRLPEWMQGRKNRGEILRAIATLRRSLST